MPEIVGLDHGGGGRRSRDLVRELFLRRFSGTAPGSETDSAVVAVDSGSLAITTDAHVVKPIEFPGGDIGRLAVCGTVNDLAVVGAEPRYLTVSFVIEEGFEIPRLEKIVDSMAFAALEAGVKVVAGDTKVVEKGGCDGLFITTAGIGQVPPDRTGIATARDMEPGDVITVNGPIGDHGATIACVRNGIPTEPPLASDCNPLSGIISGLYSAGTLPRFMRDATRGGLATVLCELAEMKNAEIEIREADLIVRDTVRGVCELYGFDPLYLANEGTFIAVFASAEAEVALQALRSHELGRDARIIGTVKTLDAARGGRASLNTAVGGSRLLRMLSGEQLPRIC